MTTNGSQRSDNWSRFTKQAQLALSNAQIAAEKLNQTLITPEHLLLGLLQTSTNDALSTLVALKLDYSYTLRQINSYLESSFKDIRPTSVSSQTIILSEEIKQVLSEAVGEANATGTQYIDSRHLLLGMMRLPSLYPAQLLKQQGISLNKVRRQAKLVQETLTDSLVEIDSKPVGDPVKISPIFILLVLATGFSSWMTYSDVSVNRFFVFPFVTGGWLISLAVHEFGHAIVSYWGGDHTVVQKGYLTLNPLKYTHVMWSIVYPLLILIAGGIGLPGGAVYINTNLIQSRVKRSLGSIAGPAGSALMGALFAIPFLFFYKPDHWFEHPYFWTALAFLVFAQVTSVFLCLLPIPGMDGYNAIEPYFPQRVRLFIQPVTQYTFFIIILVFFYNNPIRDGFWAGIEWIMQLIDIDMWLVYSGLDLFHFWKPF